MNLKGDKTIVNKSDDALFEFLTDINNFKSVLPENMNNLEVGDDYMLFNMQGIPPVKMVFVEKTPNRIIKLKADNNMVPLFLTCEIKPLNNKQSEAQLSIDGEVNMIMASMVKKPLQNLLDMLSQKMTTL